MNELLADIKAKLQRGDYKNEEHIRLSLVARVLQNLGWDIWNPKEVNTEFIVVPKEDKTHVDVALFLRPIAPAVFIEIKDAGQIQGRLANIERQLRDYNRNHTAMFTIITDGREWRFYYSQTGGEFSKKLFETFNFEEDNLNDIEESFATFLRKSEIENGNAKDKAENFLQKNQKQRTAEDCLPEARRKISEPPYPSLPDALMSLVRDEGFTITQDEAEKFIKEAAERKLPTGVFQSPIKSNISKRGTENMRHKPQKPGGKIAFVDAALLSGKYTKPEVVSALSKEFNVPEKTSKNTVSWCASTMMKRHGKESNHLPNPTVKKMVTRIPARKQQ